MFSRLATLALPWWGRFVVAMLAAACMFLLGWSYGERAAGERQIAYMSAQAAQTVRIAKSQIQVLQKTEIKYRDRIKTVYLQGEKIESSVPQYVTADDGARFGVNRGFVRTYNAAWTGDDPGPPSVADREPADVPLADIAESTAFNATACRAWREQAIGLKEFYGELQRVTNGAGAPQEPH